MRTVPSLPWWGWAIIAFVVLNVLLDMNVSIFVPIIIGWIAAGVLSQRGSSEQKKAEQHGSGQPLPPYRPDSGSDRSTLGWAGGPDQGATPPPVGRMGEPPTTAPTQSGPGHSPWVHRPGEQPGPGATPAPGAPGSGTATGPGMPRIDVPQYPHGSTPPPVRPPGQSSAYPPGHPSTYSTANPTVGASPSTDPVVSLGQLHLSRCARDLHTAATTGSTQDVMRVLEELREQSDRLLGQLSGAGALPGSGRREFESGLRRLQRDVAAARGEDPPGPKVARVARAAGTMGQTGRYE
ncbi:hypothetical protein [Ornithinimicrobium sufpigmenti]|uniref:hypothetical protein n=1 Tax=Ornithinimicrobium sufpigmenti TaxID=2508882 RepID=UPI001035700A|nr:MULTISPECIES: hypothetical protein [unclassified Ornithinimicrobium]